MSRLIGADKSAFRNVKDSLVHYIYAAAELIGGQPVRVIVLVAASLVAQVALLLAFLLPIKIVLMLGSNHMPRYFPEFLSSVGRQELILFSCLAALASFLIYFLSQRFVESGTEKVTRRALRNNRKMVALSNQLQRSTRICRSYIQSLSGAAFVVLALAIIGFLYPALAIVISASLAFLMSFSLLTAQFSRKFSRYLDKNVQKYTRFMAVLAFLITFAFIISDFLVPLNPPHFFSALIGLLLSRQVFSRSVMLVQSVRSLSRGTGAEGVSIFVNRNINNPPAQKSAYDGAWQLLEPQRLESWLQAAVGGVIGGNVSALRVDWIRSFRPGVFSVAIDVNAGESLSRQCYRVKVFDESKLKVSEKEEYFLSSNPKLSSLVGFIGALNVGESRCQVYRWDSTARLIRSCVKSRVPVFKSAADYVLPRDFSELYLNTHSQLPERLAPEVLDKVSIFASDEDAAILDRVKSNLITIIKSISELPQQLVFLKYSSVISSPEGDHYPGDFDQWAVEPLGFGWPVEDSLDEFTGLFDEVASKRPDVETHMLGAVFLCKKLSEFERYFRAHNFDAAIDCIRLLERQVACGQSTFFSSARLFSRGINEKA